MSSGLSSLIETPLHSDTARRMTCHGCGGDMLWEAMPEAKVDMDTGAIMLTYLTVIMEKACT